ncbi:MAG: hypothetical protein KY395_06490 [Actinobacteria bacterium]|nr:hypothetical protein [Actinomycetota bacterium]
MRSLAIYPTPLALSRLGGVAAIVGCLALVAGLLFVASAPASAAEGDPVGNLDSVSVRAAFTQDPRDADKIANYEVFGWAADPNDDSDPGSVEVHIYVDGNKAGVTSTGGDGNERPDVQRAHPWAPSHSGWFASVSWPAGSGTHRVCAYAINEGAGSNNTTLGCVRVRPGARSSGDPVAHLDTIHVGTGLIQPIGWAGDPDGNGPIFVRVYYDGILRTHLLADNERPDVNRAFPRLSSQTGFNETLPITPGDHRVCLYAVNEGRTGRANTALGCVFVRVPGEPAATEHDPKGALDEFRPGDPNQALETMRARGWAYDPDAEDIGVQVRVLAYVFQPLEPAVVDLPTDVERFDVQRAHPGATPPTGFDGDVATGRFRPVITMACVWAPNVGEGSGPNRLLGCGNTLG